MKKKRKRSKHSTEPLTMPQMPFDDALRKILSAPSKHKIGKKKKKCLTNL